MVVRPYVDTFRAWTPWASGDDLVRWLAGSGAAAIMLVGSWYLASGEPAITKQIGPLNLGIAALVAAGWANAWWLTVGRRALRERLEAAIGTEGVDRNWLPQMMPTPEVLIADRVLPATRRNGHVGNCKGFVGGSELKYYHDPRCIMAAGRDWPVMKADKHVRAGRQPCPICRPSPTTFEGL